MLVTVTFTCRGQRIDAFYFYQLLGQCYLVLGCWLFACWCFELLPGLSLSYLNIYLFFTFIYNEVLSLLKIFGCIFTIWINYTFRRTLSRISQCCDLRDVMK